MLFVAHAKLTSSGVTSTLTESCAPGCINIRFGKMLYLARRFVMTFKATGALERHVSTNLARKVKPEGVTATLRSTIVEPISASTNGPRRAVDPEATEAAPRERAIERAGDATAIADWRRSRPAIDG